MKILLAGTGAVGCYYGGKLAQAGAEIVALCRSDYDAVSKEGIEVSSPDGDFSFTPSQVIRHASELKIKPDLILCALKVLPEIDLASIIRDAVGPETTLFLLQNGFEIERPLREAFPANEIIGGLAFICAARIAPGKVAHLDYGHIAIGSYPGKRGAHAGVDCAKLGTLFESAGVNCSVEADLIEARWRKLIWNAPFNPISVLAGGADTREILGDPESRALTTAVMQEIVMLSKADGHPLPDSIIAKNIRLTETMKPYKTSMLLDHEAGRPMEVEAILGNTVRRGRELGCKIPHLESIYALLKLVNRKSG